MSATPILILSADTQTPAPFADAVLAGRLCVIEQTALTDNLIADASGVITTMHLDQIDFASRRDAISAMLRRGGRLAFMGHLMRPFLPGLRRFIPLNAPRRGDFSLIALNEHPLFAGIDRRALEQRRGVAGFYGRGHMPLPVGALPLTGLGPLRVPVDWVWEPPGGGAIFAHAGNDLWSITDDRPANLVLAERLMSWITKTATQHEEERHS